MTVEREKAWVIGPDNKPIEVTFVVSAEQKMKRIVCEYLGAPLDEDEWDFGPHADMLGALETFHAWTKQQAGAIMNEQDGLGDMHGL